MDKKITHYLEQQKSSQALVRNIIRLGFLGLLIFEFLNVIHVLNDSLDFTWRGLFFTALVAWLILEVVAFLYFSKKHFMLHWSIWIVVAIGIGMDASADIFHLYARFDRWDELVHFFNSSAICFGVFIVITAFYLDNFSFKILGQHERLKLALYIAATTTLALGALYEIEEYTEDLIFGTHRSGPGTDTPDDLLFNAIGVTVMIIILAIVVYNKKKKYKLLS